MRVTILPESQSCDFKVTPLFMTVFPNKPSPLSGPASSFVMWGDIEN